MAGAPAGPGPLIVAHRGAWGERPQNSLAALEHAIALGCEMVELDIRRTRDGHLVALHDARVRGVPVRTLDLEQLRRRLPAGSAPRLREMAEAAAGRIALDVELKEDGYVAEALAELAAALEPDGYVVSSFLDTALLAARNAAPEVRTGLLIRAGGPSQRLEARLAATGASFLGPPLRAARPPLLAWAAERGLRSYVWTVNGTRALRALMADERVEAVITDRPERALTVRRSGR